MTTPPRKFSKYSATKKTVALLAVFALFFAGTYFLRQKDAPAFSTLQDYKSQELSWSTCYDTFDCSTLSVPIDYSDLSIGSFDIGILRHSATDQANRIGSLVVNPGGPGASGMEYAYNAEYIVSSGILAKYDIVGFDPRGVGDSTPIHCLTDKETDANYAADSKPDSPAEFDAQIKQAQQYIAECEAKTPNLTHYGTVNAARDMDLLRIALGDSTLNFLGKSYGTYLGTLYAQLFPDKVGRMILDGAIDPNITAVQQSIAQAVGFDRALNAFITDCYKRKNCSLQKPAKAAVKQFIQLFTTAAKKPLTGTPERPVTESLVVLGTASALYDNTSGWPQLRSALKESLKGNGSTFLDLADQYSLRNPDGTYGSNETDAAFVIDCLDWPETRTAAEMFSDAKTFAKAAPVFGPYLAYGALSCKYIPGIENATPRKITSITTSPIIIIGTTRDPATPYEWAQALHSEIKNSRLISLNADGHTGHGRGSKCVDSAVDKYLLTGKLPGADLACAL